jgi:hypothetical protein
MPVLKISRADVLRQQATAHLKRLVKFDLDDQRGRFREERFMHVDRLRAIFMEAESLGYPHDEFYAGVISDVEIYESDR